jgi:hypothetical protein
MDTHTGAARCCEAVLVSQLLCAKIATCRCTNKLDVRDDTVDGAVHPDT